MSYPWTSGDGSGDDELAGFCDYLRDLYKSFRNTLDRFHDDSEYRLPMPARYVRDKEGTIRAADVHADYTIRPEASETVKVLQALKT